MSMVSVIRFLPFLPFLPVLPFRALRAIGFQSGAASDGDRWTPPRSGAWPASAGCIASRKLNKGIDSTGAAAMAVSASPENLKRGLIPERL